MKPIYIRSITVIAVFFTCILALGFSMVIREQFFISSGVEMEEKPPKEVPEQIKKTKVVLALGDSLTRGTGDPQGKGYVGKVVEELEERSNEKLTLFNWAVKGQRSDGLASQLEEKEVRRQIKQADLILITIGGNDLFQGGQSLMELDEKRIKKIEESYLTNLDRIFNTIRSLNKEAVVFHIGLYDPFLELETAEITAKIIRDWNFESAEVAVKYPKIVEVPTFDLFQLKVSDYLYTDQFHPNSEGYRLIAERVASLIAW